MDISAHSEAAGETTPEVEASSPPAGAVTDMEVPAACTMERAAVVGAKEAGARVAGAAGSSEAMPMAGPSAGAVTALVLPPEITKLA